MKVSDCLKMVEENPEIKDYTLCLSEYFAIPADDDDPEDYTIVTDFPIAGIATNDEEKELRFVMRGSDMHLIEQGKDRILKFVKELPRDGKED